MGETLSRCFFFFYWYDFFQGTSMILWCWTQIMKCYAIICVTLNWGFEVEQCIVIITNSNYLSKRARKKVEKKESIIFSKI